MSPDILTIHPPANTDLDAFIARLAERIAPPAELLTRETFAALLDIGASTFDKLRERGEVGPKPIRLAGLKWHRAEALAWLSHRDQAGELHDSKTWPAMWAVIQRKAGIVGR